MDSHGNTDEEALGCARDPRLIWGIEKDVLCIGNGKAIKFMEDIVDYVCRLFLRKFVHIGGG